MTFLRLGGIKIESMTEVELSLSALKNSCYLMCTWGFHTDEVSLPDLFIDLSAHMLGLPTNTS